ncbi:Fe(2+) transport protein 2, partial [Cucurbita argyrosperma subsp. argyrosperma]
MASSTSLLKLISIFLFLISFLTTQVVSQSNQCETTTNSCTNKDKATLSGGHFHGHHHRDIKELNVGSQLLRYRVIAMVLELGIVVHSVVIGLSLGATNDTCTIKGLVINITNFEVAPMVNLIRTIKNNYWSYIIS